MLASIRVIEPDATNEYAHTHTRILENIFVTLCKSDKYSLFPTLLSIWDTIWNRFPSQFWAGYSHPHHISRSQPIIMYDIILTPTPLGHQGDYSLKNNPLGHLDVLRTGGIFAVEWDVALGRICQILGMDSIASCPHWDAACHVLVLDVSVSICCGGACGPGEKLSSHSCKDSGLEFQFVAMPGLKAVV